MLGDLEKSCSAFWRNRARLFGGIVLGDLEESFSVIWRNRSWRFGGIVLDDLEELVVRIGGHHGVAYISLTVVEAYDEGKNVDKLWRPELY